MKNIVDGEQGDSLEKIQPLQREEVDLVVKSVYIFITYENTSLPDLVCHVYQPFGTWFVQINVSHNPHTHQGSQNNPQEKESSAPS